MVPAISATRGFMYSTTSISCPGEARISPRTSAVRDPRVLRSATRIVSSKLIHSARLRAVASLSDQSPLAPA